MRILQYTFFASLFLLLTAFVFFMILQEILLFVGVSQVQSAIQDVKKTEVVDVCAAYLSEYGDLDIGHQVKFVSDTEFVSEAYCKTFNSNMREIDRNTLAPFVAKIPGSSGLILNTELSTVGLTVFPKVYAFLEEKMGIPFSVFQRKRYIVIRNQDIETTTTFEAYGETPVAACESYGYVCCDSVAHIGQGEVMPGNTSCEKSCYQSCIKRPVVLSFMSDPFPDIVSRVVRLRNGDSIDFNYLTDVGQSPTATAIISFGDGNSTTLEGKSGNVLHTYQCSTPYCEFTATVVVRDAAERDSVISPLSTITVQVSR